MFSGIWRKAKKKNMKKERKFGLKEFPRPLISWNGGASKYDIRDWAPQHEKMGKGITLSKDEIKELYKILGKILEE